MMALKKSTDIYSLANLLDGFVRVSPADDCYPTGIKSDSRRVQKGDLFLACPGFTHNGADYINEAIAAGACAVVVDKDFVPANSRYSVPVMAVGELNSKAGFIADRFYHHPSAHMQVIGVTGTNGKTSITHIIAQVLSAAHANDAGVIGTLGIGSPGKLLAGKNTTPDALTIHAALAKMRDQGSDKVVMEVSSHALVQARVAGINFDIGIFTNLSREHLDYHGDMESYADAKRLLFLPGVLDTAVVNVDDEFGRKLAGELQGKLKLVTYATGEKIQPIDSCSHVSGHIICSVVGRLDMEISSPWGEGSLSSKLTGEFNASNLLACVSALCLSGMSLADVLEHLSAVEPIPGRMECFNREGGARVIVDYAHTPDALEKALKSLAAITEGNLTCVVGCGGDRDRTKRPHMGRIAESYSDNIIFTNDNPRNEDPVSIVEQMLAGTTRSDRISVVLDRSAAIRQAIDSALPNDVVLIAGKGHETWQEIAGVRTPFSDRQLVRNLMEQMG